MCAKLDWSDLFANSMYIIRNYFLGFFFFFCQDRSKFFKYEYEESRIDCLQVVFRGAESKGRLGKQDCALFMMFGLNENCTARVSYINYDFDTFSFCSDK